MIQNDIPHLMFRVYVTHSERYDYRENGIDFFIEFDDELEFPQCEIFSSETTPLTGPPMIHEAIKEQTYGENIVYRSIPLEMLYTRAESP